MDARGIPQEGWEWGRVQDIRAPNTPLAALMRGLCVGAALPAPPGMSAQLSLFARDTLGTSHSRELPLLCA